MGNCCHSESKAQSAHEERIRKQHDADEAKRQLEEGLRNMASGGHQMLSSFTAPYSFTPAQGRSYFKWHWPESGSVLVTSFGVRVVAQGQSVQFVEGLANYATFQLHWQPHVEPAAAQSGSGGGNGGLVEIRLDTYHSVDANSGEQTAVSTCPKLFVVERATGRFVRVLNVDELVDEAVALAVAAAGADKSPAQKEELRRLLLQQRDVMIRGVVDDIALMWRCFVECWTHEEQDAGSTEVIWGTKCTRRKRLVQSEQSDNKKILDKFYDDLFQNMSHEHPSILRPQVVLEKAVQMQVYNGLFTTDGIRCHQASYRKWTESTISIQNVTSCRAEFEGKRYVFGWPDIPALTSRAYMVSLFSEYASVGGAFHDRMAEKYAGQRVGGDEQVDIMQMIVNHPFVTEPNDSVVQADQNKQKIAGMIQMANGAHSMFSGLSPPISYPPKQAGTEYYTFRWPRDGLVKVCALGFTLRVVDQDVAFTQGLGTFIMFDVRWQPCSDCAKYNVPEGTVELFLENNILINAQSGTEEPLSEPVKHLLISAEGALLQIVNMSELVDYAIETAILQRSSGGQVSAEEKAQYRAMLISTQKATLTQAVQSDLGFIWSSWVQLWASQPVQPEREQSHFGLATVELALTHASAPEANRATVANLIHSVLSNSAAEAEASAAGGSASGSGGAGAGGGAGPPPPAREATPVLRASRRRRPCWRDPAPAA